MIFPMIGVSLLHVFPSVAEGQYFKQGKTKEPTENLIKLVVLNHKYKVPAKNEAFFVSKSSQTNKKT